MIIPLTCRPIPQQDEVGQNGSDTSLRVKKNSPLSGIRGPVIVLQRIAWRTTPYDLEGGGVVISVFSFNDHYTPSLPGREIHRT